MRISCVLLSPTFGMHQYAADLVNRMAQAGRHLSWVPQAVVKHYGKTSSRQAAQEMCIQLYRGKVQFPRELGGAQHAKRLEALVGLAYVPRLLVATGDAHFCAGEAGPHLPPAAGRAGGDVGSQRCA